MEDGACLRMCVGNCDTGAESIDAIVSVEDDAFAHHALFCNAYHLIAAISFRNAANGQLPETNITYAIRMDERMWLLSKDA